MGLTNRQYVLNVEKMNNMIDGVDGVITALENAREQIWEAQDLLTVNDYSQDDVSPYTTPVSGVAGSVIESYVDIINESIKQINKMKEALKAKVTSVAQAENKEVDDYEEEQRKQQEQQQPTQ